jgi:CDP-glycerol glycerophosphotransferase (TagB/SpsB family)
MSIFKIFRYQIKKIVFFTLSFLNILLPKNKNNIFFSDISEVRENQYVLYKFLIDNKYYNDYKIIYYSKNKEAIEAGLRGKSKVVSSFLVGCYYKLTSKFVIYAFGSNRFECIIPKKQVVLNLWHGFGLKKVGYCITPKSFYKAGNCFSYILIPSPYFADIVKKSYNCCSNQLFVGGQPKNDYLFCNNGIDAIKEMGINKNNYKSVIIFLPTYRNSKRLGFNGHIYNFLLSYQDKIEKIDSFLKENECLLIIKLHHTEQIDSNIEIRYKNFQNIIFFRNSDLDSKNVPFYIFLSQTDALVTDYSSVYQDYLLIDKPVGFVIEDIEEYSRVRGFNFKNILDLMPGKKIYNINDLKDFILDVVTNKDLYSKDRKRINNLMNYYHDSNNCKRILDFLEIKLDEG